ncbi:MAG: hypothetical protein QOI80_3867, partial [Solirubrobacteraceae bacterium]|nr:hypothetical protein [Solirubrobacteraceae bacterium]
DVTTRSRKTCVILGSFSGYGPAVDTVLRDSVLHDCGDPAHGALDHAVYASHVRGARIVGNLIYGAATYAVQLYPSAKRVLIRDNVLADNGGGVIFAGEGNRASSDDVVERNVIAGSTRDDNIAAYWGDRVGTGNVVRRNCLGGGPVGNLEAERGFTPTDNVEAEPGFVDPAARDYRLRQGSACIAVVGSMPAAPAFTLQSARRAP